MPRRGLALFALVTLGIAALAGCGDDAETLTIYSGRQEALVGPLLQQFAEEEGVDIDVKYDDSANLAVLIDTEGENSPADVFLSQSPGAIGFVDGEGRLDRLPDEVIEHANRSEQLEQCGLTPDGIAGRARELAEAARLPLARETA